MQCFCKRKDTVNAVSASSIVRPYTELSGKRAGTCMDNKKKFQFSLFRNEWSRKMKAPRTISLSFKDFEIQKD